MQTRASSCSRRRAFTLVELLVVIGIIGLLISILLPALNRAREQARMIKCASNERQIFQYVMMYVQENRGQLPVPPGVNDAPPPTTSYPLAYWMTGNSTGLGATGIGIAVFGKTPVTTTRTGSSGGDEGALMVYFPPSTYSRQQIFTCPSDQLGFGPSALGGATFITQRNFSYSFTGMMQWDFVQHYYHGNFSANNVFKAINIAQVRHPANKICIFEEEAPNDGVCELLSGAGSAGQPFNFTSVNPGGDYPANRHLGTDDFNQPSMMPTTTPPPSTWRQPIGFGNYCFFDGHVETHSVGEIFEHARTTTILSVDEWYNIFQ
ncbi:MAG TPA: prepilin-type N-terminal cleavage/methylation domain-containing protein [Tepidisphaeraceae bacterium]|jgi:prepilin-type N-terminal cleavage/methylation domain-containing protein/prepilin-type processing-associated H-X9-DG protein